MTTAGESCVATPPGSASDSVTVEGDFGVAPKITFDTPITAEETQRSVVIAGEGAVAGPLASVMVEVSLLNGTTGEEITTTKFDGSQTLEFELDPSTMLRGLVKTIECSSVGERVVGVIPAAEGYGTDGREDLKVGATDTLVFVADIISIVPPVAPIAAPVPFGDIEGLPAVEFDSSGVPTITIPTTEPPEKTEIGIIEEGTGEVVGADADVVVHYRGVNWNTGKTFDDSWARGEPSPFNTGGVIAGFRAALEGQKVGSTLIAVIAPVDGYGESG
jgi:peptidylprolyl isomerase